MDKINFSNLNRNPDVIKSYFKTIGDTIVTTANLKVIFPERYINRELVFMGSTVRIISIFCIIDENNNYAVVSAPIFQELAPYNVTDSLISEEPYKMLHFNKNDVFTVSKMLVKTDGFIYDIFDEFYIKGNIPIFLSYEDIAELLLESKKYAGTTVGSNALTLEILTAVIARDPEDKTGFIRQIFKNELEKKKLTPAYVGLNNIFYSFDNTSARLVGGYFGQGVTTSIIDKETETTLVADLLRA